jgi:hypothetical protein
MLSMTARRASGTMARRAARLAGVVRAPKPQRKKAGNLNEEWRDIKAA